MRTPVLGGHVVPSSRVRHLAIFAVFVIIVFIFQVVVIVVKILDATMTRHFVCLGFVCEKEAVYESWCRCRLYRELIDKYLFLVEVKWKVVVTSKSTL